MWWWLGWRMRMAERRGTDLGFAGDRFDVRIGDALSVKEVDASLQDLFPPLPA